eukprot:gene5693-9513_t
MKQLIIILFCLFALAHSKYIVQRIYGPEDIDCSTAPVFGSFFEDKKCHSAGTTIQRSSCNSTHVKTEFECNLECTRCGRSISYPINKCIQGFVNVKISCVDTLPEIKEKGIYLRTFTNSQCKNYPVGDHGTFLIDEYCSNAPQKGLLSEFSFGTRPKSQKNYFDKNENVFKTEAYEEKECKGNYKTARFPVDKCLKMPNPSFKTAQPPTHAIFSRK